MARISLKRETALSPDPALAPSSSLIFILLIGLVDLPKYDRKFAVLPGPLSAAERWLGSSEDRSIGDPRATRRRSVPSKAGWVRLAVVGCAANL